MNVKSMRVFQSDFTYREGAVSAMYGVVKSVDRSLEIIDSTHEIPQYDTWSASFRLLQTVRFWPSDTIFVSAVDPGVGTKRRACVAKTKRGNYIFTPDNRTLTHLLQDPGIDEIREIDETRNRFASTIGTAVFHGRDLFGYCAAKLASGLITFEEVGPAYPIEEIVTHEIPQATFDTKAIHGVFEIMDPNFGNFWTNIPVGMLQERGVKFGDEIMLQVKHKDSVLFEQKIPYHPTFGYVPKGQPVLYNNELMNLAFAICMDSAAVVYGLHFGPDWHVTITEVL